jgi:nitroreductase
MVLSCGTALHHARLAFAAVGLRPLVRRLPNPDEPDHLASIELQATLPAESDAMLATMIPRRRSDRRPYRDWPPPGAFLAELSERAANEGAVLRVLADGARGQLVPAARDAAAVQGQSAGCQTELSLWSARHASTDGIPPGNLPREPIATLTANRDFVAGDLDVADEPDGGVLLVIGTASDDTLSRLRAGEAISDVLLVATELGLATCLLTQPLEVASVRRFVRDELLDGTLTPQAIVRLGWAPEGPPLPATPRRPVDEVIHRLGE